MFSSIQLPSSLALKKILTAIRTIAAVNYDVQAVAPVNTLELTTGQITANGQTVVADVTDAGTAAVVVDGTYGTVALAFEGSVDGVTYVALAGTRTDSATVETASGNLSNTTRGWEFCVAGFAAFRARATAYTSGTMNVNIGQSPAATEATPSVVLAAGTNTVGALSKATTGGATPFKLISAATTNATSVKGAAGQVYSLHASNAAGAFRYVKLYNKATAPTVGTDTPVLVFGIPAGGSINCALPDAIGAAFATGIALAIVTGAADSDATAVALNDVALSLTYA